MDQVISLYKEEIATYQQQVEDLKQRNRECDSKNAVLIGKIRSLEDLVEKANVANRDLNIAFEHVHQENLRIQMNQANNQDALAITNPNKQMAVTDVDTKRDQVATESLVWMSEREHLKQRNKFLERECERYHRDNIHLGKQVRHLLKTLEEERGMIIRHQSQVASSDRVTCAADVIDKHLITFESIEELQQQNQKLLSLVKNLSAEQEEREVKVESEEVKRLTTDLEELKSQLTTIKSDRERVLKALTSIHKERDLFKILLCKTRQVEHMTPEIFQRMVAVACSSGPAISDTGSSSIEREAHIEDLKKMISNLEHNLTTIKAELDESRSLSAAELKLKNDLLEKAHIRISEMHKQLEAINERNQMLESNIQAFTKEFDDSRTKCQKLTFELDEANKKLEEAHENLENANKRGEEAVQRMRQQTQQELASMFNQELDRCLELQQKLIKAQNDMIRMQDQRNLERHRRLKLHRLLNGRPRARRPEINNTAPASAPTPVQIPERKLTKKRTKKRRPVIPIEDNQMQTEFVQMQQLAPAEQHLTEPMVIEQQQQQDQLDEQHQQQQQQQQQLHQQEQEQEQEHPVVAPIKLKRRVYN